MGVGCSAPTAALRTPWLEGCFAGRPQAPARTLSPCWRFSGCRFLMRVLDSYGDDYRAGQFTIVLEASGARVRAGVWAAGPWPGHGLHLPRVPQDEGSQGTDAPTPGNAENEPPEREGLSPPMRTSAPPEPGSPTPGEGTSGRKRRRAPRDSRRGGAAPTPELAPVQVRGRAGGRPDPGVEVGASMGLPCASHLHVSPGQGGGGLRLRSRRGPGFQLGVSRPGQTAALPHPGQPRLRLTPVNGLCARGVRRASRFYWGLRLTGSSATPGCGPGGPVGGWARRACSRHPGGALWAEGALRPADPEGTAGEAPRSIRAGEAGRGGWAETDPGRRREGKGREGAGVRTTTRPGRRSQTPREDPGSTLGPTGGGKQAGEQGCGVCLSRGHSPG